MDLRDRVRQLAEQEAANYVGLGTNVDQTLAYFLASTGKRFTVEEARPISWCTYFVHWVLRQAGVHPLPVQGYEGALYIESKDLAKRRAKFQRSINKMKAGGADVTDLLPLPSEMTSYGGFSQTIADSDNNWEVINPWTGAPEYKPAEPGISSTSRFMNTKGGVYNYHPVTDGVCPDGYQPATGDMYYKPKNWVERKIDGKITRVHDDVMHVGLLIELRQGTGPITIDGNSGHPHGQEPYTYSPGGEHFLGGGYVRKNDRSSWEDIQGVMELPTPAAGGPAGPAQPGA